MTLQIEQLPTEDFVKKSYKAYGTYVVLDRAIPDVRDGLKPVQRRVLWAINRLGLKPGSGTRKSAKIIGDTIGDFHPHGTCLRGSTKFLCLDGKHRTIKELYEAKLVLDILAYDLENKRLVPAKAHSFRIGQRASKLYHVKFSNGEIITVTSNHPFLTKFGLDWIETKDLKLKTTLKHYHLDPFEYPLISETCVEPLGLHRLVGLASYGYSEAFHHINKVKTDNRPENLRPLTNSEHRKLHYVQEPERSLAGLTLGRNTMFLDASPIRNAIRKKNSILLKNHNIKLPLLKAKKILALIEADGLEINETNYLKYRTRIYNGTNLATIKAHNTDIFQLKDLDLDKFFNLKSPVGFTRLKNVKSPVKYTYKQENLLAMQGLLLEELFNTNPNPTWEDLKHFKCMKGKENHRYRFSIKSKSEPLEAAKKIKPQYCLFIEEINIEELSEPEIMYDFTVDKFENALVFVGNSNELVVAHNSGTYNALCNMATPWTFKVPMVEPQGNFGGITGEPPAADRYTEAGITFFGHSNFEDKKYLDFVSNYDGKTEEPVVLSALLPNLLIEGYGGIALGYAGRIPSHDIVDVAKLALQYHKNGALREIYPQLESKTFLLNPDQAETIYKTGEGTLSYCSHYNIDSKAKTITVKGFAPQVSPWSIKKSLKDLIDRGLIEIFGDSDGLEADMEITFKDTRLLESRVLPTLCSKESYKFYAITEDNLIKLYNLEGILQDWRKHRLLLWTRRINDIIQGFEKDLKELQTQLAIIQNYDLFIDAIKQNTLAKMRAGFTFIPDDMKDYALGLKIQQIAKINETTLKQKISEITKKLNCWKATTPESELEKQLVEQIDYYEKLNIARTTTNIGYSELPRFEGEALKDHWIVAYSDQVSIETEPPTRGRGFAGLGITKCKESFSLISRKGWQEKVSIFQLPKQFNYITHNGELLLLVPDIKCLIVILDEKNCLHVKHNIKGDSTWLIKNTKVKQLLLIQEGDCLRIRYADSKLKVLTYEQVASRATSRVTGGYEEYKGYQNPADLVSVAYRGQLYTSEGLKNPAKSLSSKEVKVFNVSKKNFVILKTGQRQILTSEQVSKVLDQIDCTYIIE